MYCLGIKGRARQKSDDWSGLDKDRIALVLLGVVGRGGHDA